jgi:putative MATE family efflux protein
MNPDSRTYQSEHSRKILTGPIAGTVFRLALPVALGMLVQFLLASTNIFWVGKISPTAQDAVTTSTVVFWTIYAFVNVVSVGVAALASRFIGAQDPERATFYVRQGNGMAVVSGIILSIIGLFSVQHLLDFMETSPETAMLAKPYLQVIFGTATLVFVVESFLAAFRAAGDTRTPVICQIIVVVTNMVLDPMLIFGVGPFPELGVAGAAISTALAEFMGLFLLAYFLRSKQLGYRLNGRIFSVPKWHEMLRIGKIGLPTASQQFIFIVVYWFLIRIVHDFGQPAAAAMGIGNRMESFSYLICYGFGVAATSMVGQNLGANQPDRAEKGAWHAVLLAVGVTSVASVVLVSFPHVISGIFSPDETVRHYAADYLVILGLSQTFMAVEIALEGAFGGAGDTIPPMLVMIPGAVIRIPMAYYLCYDLNLGLNGVWWTLTITTFVKATVLALWFKRGAWKLKIV